MTDFVRVTEHGGREHFVNLCNVKYVSEPAGPSDMFTITFIDGETMWVYGTPEGLMGKEKERWVTSTM